MTDIKPNSQIGTINQWFENEGHRLWTFLRSRVGSDSDADDLSQTVYLRAVNGAFTEGSNLNAWIFTIAANSARDHFRGKKRSPDSLQGQEHDPSADSRSALEAIIQNEEASAVRSSLKRCLEQLSKSEFAVVDARVRGITHIEIAVQQEWVSPNRSEKTFFRAKQKLKICLESGEPG